MSFDWEKAQFTWETPEQDDSRKPPLWRRVKDNIRAFLTEVLPDPPPDESEGEITETFRISTAGDNVVFGPKLVRVEVGELYFSPEGGANNITIKVGGQTALPTQLFPNQSFFSVPPFVVLPTQTVVLNISAATSVVGRIRYRITFPFRHGQITKPRY